MLSRELVSLYPGLGLWSAVRFPRHAGPSPFLLFLVVATLITSAAAPMAVGEGSEQRGLHTSLATGFPTPIQHVVEIFFENQALGDVLSKGPYESMLYSDYAGASNFYSICHPSAPNYLGVTSGTVHQCGSDALVAYPDENIADLAATHGLDWNAYLEEMPGPCDTANTSLYEAHHNPFLYYPDLTGQCTTHDLPLANLTADFPFSSTPAAYTWISPDMDNDGHDTGVPVADHWLSQFLPKVMAESWFSSTAIFIQYDESCDGGTGCDGATDTSSYPALEEASGCENSSEGCGGHIYLAVVSPYTKGTGLYTANATDWNVLCTEEWLLGLPATGNEDCTGSFTAMKSMFDFPSTSSPAGSSLLGLPMTDWLIGLGVGIGAVVVVWLVSLQRLRPASSPRRAEPPVPRPSPTDSETGFRQA